METELREDCQVIARGARLAGREALDRVVVGSSPRDQSSDRHETPVVIPTNPPWFDQQAGRSSV